MGINIGSIITSSNDASLAESSPAIDDVYYDNDWFDIRFIPPSSQMAPIDVFNRFYTTASRKFGSTMLGSSFAINPPPQYGRNADIRHGNKAFKPLTTPSALTEDGGYGRAYSEVHDDGQQLVMFQFGKEKFNSLPNFILSAIDYRDSYIANWGRYPTGYDLGTVLGNGIMLAAFPWITLTIWGLKLASKLVLGSDSFNFYYLEPTMHLYWSTVNELVTVAATEYGILIPELMPDGSEAKKIGVPVKLNQQDLNDYKKFMPGLFTENNYIDVFKIATTPQTLANRVLLKEYELFQKGETSSYDFLGYVYKDGVVQEKPVAGSGIINELNYNLSFSKFLDRLTKGNGLFSKVDDTAETTVTTKPQYTKDGKGLYEAPADKTTYLEKLTEAVDAGIKEGGAYAVFNVDFVGSSTETFSNSIGNIDLGDKINSVAASARNIKFNLAGGNILGETANKATDAVANFMKGTLDSVSMGLSGVLATLTGNAYVDLPKKWESSDMSFTSHTYSMQLRALYNTPFSILKDEIIPLCMILAGVLPLSAGNSSHASPFLCEFFSKGITHSKLSMITNVTISRGTANLAFDKNKRYRGIDITFTVTDFSSIMTAPVNASLFSSFNVALEDNRPINRYLAVIASRDLLTSKYMVPKMKLKASRLLMNIDQAFSPHSWGLRGGLPLNNILGGLVADHAISISESNRY